MSYLSTRASTWIRKNDFVEAHEATLENINLIENHFLKEKKSSLDTSELAKYLLLAYSNFMVSALKIYEDNCSRLGLKYLRKGSHLIKRWKFGTNLPEVRFFMKVGSKYKESCFASKFKNRKKIKVKKIKRSKDIHLMQQNEELEKCLFLTRQIKKNTVEKEIVRSFFNCKGKCKTRHPKVYHRIQRLP